MRAPPSKCEPPAYFFKFIPPGFMWQLSIPKSFRKYIKGGKRDIKTAILRRGCQKWRVKIIEGWVFREGWEVFVRENGVQETDFVVFKHEGNMVFNTFVFDSSCCERDYPEANSSDKCENYTTDISMESLLNAEKTMIPDHDRHPYFIGTLKSKWKYKMYLPKKFVLANGLRDGEMILKNEENGGSWKVKLTDFCSKYFYLSRGWNQFRIANGLEEGDSFRFELIKNGEKPLARISSIH